MTKARDLSLAAKAPIASPVFTGNVGVGAGTALSPLDVKSGFITVSKDANTAGRVGASEYITGSTANDLIVQATGSGVTKLYQSGVNSLNIDAAGIVTKPLQPAFQAYKSSTNSNKTPNVEHVVLFGAENFDIGSNFAANYFTAPVTGKYQLTTNIRADDIDSAAAYYQVRIVTSNRAYYSIFDPDFGQDFNYWHLSYSILADMDAGDTAYVGFYQNGGSAQTDIDGDSKYTNFSGFLAC